VKPVTDISHLMKRKRPDGGSEPGTPKKLCSNGTTIASSQSPFKEDGAKSDANTESTNNGTSSGGNIANLGEANGTSAEDNIANLGEAAN